MPTARRASKILKHIHNAAEFGADLGLEIHAGHGLTYDNVEPIAAIPHIRELNIGHFLIGEAIFTGLEASIAEMRALMDEARAMILGLGNDLIDIRRIEKTIADPWRAVPRPHLHRYRARQIRPPRQPRRQLCQALRRQGGLRQGAGHRAEPWRLLARHGGGEPAGRQAHHGADRRRAETAGRNHARRAYAPRST